MNAHNELRIAPRRQNTNIHCVQPGNLRASARGRTPVKSAVRVMSILEYFNSVRQPAPEREVCEALGLPQASASALLHTLSNLGYLHYDQHTRLYSLSERVSLLGSWLGPEFVREGRVVRLMADLQAETHQTVGLVQRRGAYIQYIHVVRPQRVMTPTIPTGSIRPLGGTVSGQVFLSSANDNEVVRLVNLANASLSAQAERADLVEIRHRLRAYEQRGYVYGDSIFCKGLTLLGAQILLSSSRPSLALVLAGETATMRLRERNFADVLLGSIHDTLEPS